jgi:hypothetical protein
MITFFGTPWQTFSSICVFFVGLLFALFQKNVFSIPPGRSVAFYLWHTAFCVLYYQYSLNNAADAMSYYTISISYDLGPDFGTGGIYFLTSFFSGLLGFSYGGTFLVYNVFGFIGMLAFASAISEITNHADLSVRVTALFIILLPGLSFWSVAIGKEALTFMATGLATWSAMHLSRRYLGMIIAILFLLFARPHMAGILLFSLAFAMMFALRVAPLKKVLVLLAALPATAVAVTFGAQFAGLGDATSTSDIVHYVETRQGYNLEGGSSVDIAGMSLPVRLITYLYRPFFFDVDSLMGLVVSLENLFVAIATLYAAWLRLRGRRSQLATFTSVFFAIFSAVALLVLANTTANLGIALRQKWMFLPMLLALFVSYFPRGSNEKYRAPSVHSGSYTQDLN